MTQPLSVPHFRQSAEGYCLPACARMVLAYHGIKLTEQELVQKLGSQIWGTPSFAIQKLANSRLEVNYREWSLVELKTILSQQPVIAFVQAGFLGYYHDDFAHAVVIIGVTPTQNFWLNDPHQPTGSTEVSSNGLLAAWAEFSYRGATLPPK
jgi:ABC-type bacteriocin/lantibiotic exporter with double-glycine peptidase domain